RPGNSLVDVVGLEPQMLWGVAGLIAVSVVVAGLLMKRPLVITAGASASAAGASASASATRSPLLADSAVVVPSSSLLLVTMLNKPTTATSPTPRLRKPRFVFFCGSWAIGACICGEGEPWEGLA